MLRIVHGFYGDRPFRRAVEAFLRHFRFDAVDTAGFISVFGHAFRSRELQGLLESWIRTPGFPLLYVKSEPDEEADGLSNNGSRAGGGRLRVRQEPFTYLGPTARSGRTRPSPNGSWSDSARHSYSRHPAFST